MSASPYREERQLMDESAKRCGQCETSGSPYFPNYDDDTIQILIHMARVQAQFKNVPKTDENKRMYHDCMSEYLARLTNNPDKLNSIYRSMYMDSLTSPNLRQVFHISEHEGRVAESVSVARSLRFCQGSLFMVTQAGEVLMGSSGESGNRSLRYVSDDITMDSGEYTNVSSDRSVKAKLLQKTLQCETYEFEGADASNVSHRMFIETECPLIDCNKQRMYFALVIPKPFLTTRKLHMTPERMKLREDCFPHNPIGTINQEFVVTNPSYNYEDVINALINPYSLQMIFTLVFSNGQERSYTLKGGERMDQIYNQAQLMDARYDNRNDYTQMNQLDDYLDATAQNIYKELTDGVIGGEHSIMKLVYSCQAMPELYFHRWITLRQLCTLYGATNHPHEHIVRHMYMWFLYDQLQQEDIDEIARLTYSVCERQKSFIDAKALDVATAITPPPPPSVSSASSAPFTSSATRRSPSANLSCPNKEAGGDKVEGAGGVEGAAPLGAWGISGLEFHKPDLTESLLHINGPSALVYRWMRGKNLDGSDKVEEPTNKEAEGGQGQEHKPSAELGVNHFDIPGLLKFIVPRSRAPIPVDGQGGYSLYPLNQLNAILNTFYFKRNPVQLVPGIGIGDHVVAVQYLDGVTPEQSLYFMRAAVSRMFPGTESNMGIALKLATWHAHMQRFAYSHCSAAVNVQAVLVPDVYSPMLLLENGSGRNQPSSSATHTTTIGKRELDDGIPVSVRNIGKRVLDMYVRCFEQGLYLFPNTLNDISVHGTDRMDMEPSVCFTNFIYACRRVSPSTYEFLDTERLRADMGYYFLHQSQGTTTLFDQVLSDEWNKSSGSGIDNVMQYVSVLSMVHTFMTHTFQETQEEVMGLLQACNMPLVKTFATNAANIRGTPDFDMIPSIVKSFWERVIMMPYMEDVRFKLMPVAA